MPKLTIELDVETHSILKEQAKKEKRSLTNYIEVTLDEVAGTSKTATNYRFSSNALQSNASSQSNSGEVAIKAPDKTLEPPKPKPKRTVIGNEDEYNNLINNFVKFLDDEQISPNDTSWELFEGIKKQVPEFKDLNITIFDKAQEIRKSKEAN